MIILVFVNMKTECTAVKNKFRKLRILWTKNLLIYEFIRRKISPLHLKQVFLDMLKKGVCGRGRDFYYLYLTKLFSLFTAES